MAVSNTTFGAKINDWVSQTEQRMEAVFKESAKRVIQKSQDGVPIDTGFLKSSLQVAIDAPVPPATRPQSTPRPGPNISAVIAGAKLGSTITAGYTANYALHVHYGTSRMAPRPFVSLAVAQWQQIVDQVSREAKNRALGGFARLSE